MDGANCTMNTEHIVIPAARKVFSALANETGRCVVEFCDGVQVHLTWERIKACCAGGIICVLRVPHTIKTRTLNLRTPRRNRQVEEGPQRPLQRS